jgi:hypothetical protein
VPTIRIVLDITRLVEEGLLMALVPLALEDPVAGLR